MNQIEFINSLKRDKARGSLAPHQIILLIALLKVYKEVGMIFFDIVILNKKFQEVWVTYKSEFKTTNNRLGLPLKVFVNKGYIKIEVKEQILDFRNLSELESKIIELKIEEVLIKLFESDKIEEYLITRISK